MTNKNLTKKELIEIETHKMKLITTLEKTKLKGYIELEKYKHELKMQELEYFRKTEKFKQDLELEVHRIRNADYKRNMQQKNYSKR